MTLTRHFAIFCLASLVWDVWLGVRWERCGLALSLEKVWGECGGALCFGVARGGWENLGFRRARKADGIGVSHRFPVVGRKLHSHACTGERREVRWKTDGAATDASPRFSRFFGFF